MDALRMMDLTLKHARFAVPVVEAQPPAQTLNHLDTLATAIGEQKAPAVLSTAHLHSLQARCVVLVEAEPASCETTIEIVSRKHALLSQRVV